MNLLLLVSHEAHFPSILFKIPQPACKAESSWLAYVNGKHIRLNQICVSRSSLNFMQFSSTINVVACWVMSLSMQRIHPNNHPTIGSQIASKGAVAGVALLGLTFVIAVFRQVSKARSPKAVRQATVNKNKVCLGKTKHVWYCVGLSKVVYVSS